MLAGVRSIGRGAFALLGVDKWGGWKGWCSNVIQRDFMKHQLGHTVLHNIRPGGKWVGKAVRFRDPGSFSHDGSQNVVDDAFAFGFDDLELGDHFENIAYGLHLLS